LTIISLLPQAFFTASSYRKHSADLANGPQGKTLAVAVGHFLLLKDKVHTSDLPETGIARAGAYYFAGFHLYTWRVLRFL
jgi:hypothetical protein